MPADIKSNLADWLVTAADNEPQPADSVVNIDDNLREIQAVVRKYLATKGADIASAATVDLAAATGQYVHVTGTTTITALGTVAAGLRYLIVFDGALTFTHNATSLILPTAANITTAAGDRCEVVSLGSGNWRCLWYQRASGEALSIGNAQPLDDTLTALAGLATGADKLAYSTGVDTFGETAFTPFARTIVDDTTQAQVLTTIGALGNGVVAKTAAYTVVAADRGKVFDCDGTFTLTLTAAATLGDGFVFGVRNSGTGTVTIDPDGTELINGAETIVVDAGRSGIVVCNGTAFKTIGRTEALPVATQAIRQVVSSAIAAANGTTTIPYDNTTPLDTEGTLVATAKITPNTTTNKVRITTSVFVYSAASASSAGDNNYVTVALFRGTTCVAVASKAFELFASDDVAVNESCLSINVTDAPAATAEQTYTLRIGKAGPNSSYWYINQSFNGMKAKNEITLEEIVA